MRFGLVLLLLLGACKFGFDSLADGAIDPGDAPAGSVVRKFGETPTADFKNVTADTYLYREAPEDTYNYGGSTTLSLEGTEKRALLRFDVTALASGNVTMPVVNIVIVSARLRIYFTTTGTGTVTIAPLVEDWIEGSSNGTVGIANHTQRTNAQAWTTPGGTASADVASFQSVAGAVNVDLPASVVQGWVNMPATNFGVRISGGGDLKFSSSEAATAVNRPELVVTYLP
jgi:hypothetical protein